MAGSFFRRMDATKGTASGPDGRFVRSWHAGRVKRIAARKQQPPMIRWPRPNKNQFVPDRALSRARGGATAGHENPATLCQARVARFDFTYAIGLTARPFNQTSKWQCGPVERPVEPTLATMSPACTWVPTAATNAELCA